MTDRRAKGEGWIAQKPRADGRWPASYVGADERRHFLYAATRREVGRKLAKALADREAGLYVGGPNQSLAAYLHAWLDHAGPSLRPRTAERYRSHVRLSLGELEHLPLRKLTPQHLAARYAALRETRAPASIAQLHAVLHGALRAAVLWHLIPRNPADAVRPPRAERREMRALSGPQVRELLAALAGDPLEALYVLAVATGMRQGELLGLRWRDVDLDAGALSVQHSLIRIGGTWRLVEPKTARSRRQIRIGGRVVAALRAHRLRQAEQLLSLGARPGPDTIVFTDRWGEPIIGAHLTERHLKPLLERVGLPAIRFHDLRHTAATLLLGEGVNPKIVSEMLGHSSVTITLDRYSHVLPTMQDDAARRMDALLG